MISVEEAHRQHVLGVLTVFTIWLPIFFWIVHLGTMAALVPYVHNHPSKWWLFWVDTGVLAAATLACIVIAFAIAARENADVLDGTRSGRTRFLAVQGVLAGVVNLILILVEGSYVLFLTTGR